MVDSNRYSEFQWIDSAVQLEQFQWRNNLDHVLDQIATIICH